MRELAHQQEGFQDKPLTFNSTTTQIDPKDPSRFSYFRNPAEKSSKNEKEEDDFFKITTDSFGIVGSTYCTNQSSQNKWQPIDTFYHAYTRDQNGLENGFVITLCDGYGGHRGNLQQDQNIFKTGQLTAKKAAELLLAYVGYDLEDDLSTIVEPLKKEVLGANLGENTRFVAIRGSGSERGVSVHGISLGTMVIGWNSETYTFTTLSPASPSKEFGKPIAFPSLFKNKAIYLIDRYLDGDTMVIPLSDSIWEVLPHRKVTDYRKIVYKNKNVVLPFAEIRLDQDFMKKLLTPLGKNASVEDVVQCIQKAACKRTEEKIQIETKKIETEQLKYQKALSTLQTFDQKIKELNELLQEKQTQLNTLKEEEPISQLQLEIKNIETQIKKIPNSMDYQLAKMNAKKPPEHFQVGSDLAIVGIVAPQNRTFALLKNIFENPKPSNPSYDSFTGPIIEAHEIFSLITTVIQKKPEYKKNFPMVLMEMEKKLHRERETIGHFFFKAFDKYAPDLPANRWTIFQTGSVFDRHYPDREEGDLFYFLQNRLEQCSNNPFMPNNLKKRYVILSLLWELESVIKNNEDVTFLDVVERWEKSLAELGPQYPKEAHKTNKDIIDEHRFAFFATGPTDTRSFIDSLKEQYGDVDFGYYIFEPTKKLPKVESPEERRGHELYSEDLEANYGLRHEYIR